MMFSIYLKAYRVVVWLGQATNDDEYLFSLLKTYSTEGMGGIRGEVEGPRARRAATELIETKPWFQRTWTRQEVHAAHEVHGSIKNGTDDGIPEPSKRVESFKFLDMVFECLSGEAWQL